MLTSHILQPRSRRQLLLEKKRKDLKYLLINTFMLTQLNQLMLNLILTIMALIPLMESK